MIHSLSLKNYAQKIVADKITEHSPYVVVECSDGKHVVVKKTSLCWLLRKSPSKLSSDRIYRVRTPYDIDNVCKSKFKTSTYKRKNRKYGLLYNPK